MSYSATLVSTLNAIAHEWSDKIDKALLELLSQPNFRNTGASASSVKVLVVEGSTERAPEIRVEFDESLNIINLHKLQWTKQPPVDDFQRWAETRALSGPVPGYKNGQAPNLPPWKAQQRRVWAIVMNKKKFDTWRPKPWRKKGLGNVLKELNAQVLKSFDEAIQKDFDQAVKV